VPIDPRKREGRVGRLHWKQCRAVVGLTEEGEDGGELANFGLPGGEHRRRSEQMAPALARGRGGSCGILQGRKGHAKGGGMAGLSRSRGRKGGGGGSTRPQGKRRGGVGSSRLNVAGRGGGVAPE
jgi:hypothetical protein